MANFNLADYETVEERIKRFYSDNADGRIVTEDYTTENDRAMGMWRVKATIYLSREDQDCDCAKATGVAFEVDGVGMANKTSALENAETSAIGRALANAGYSGNKRASREEMAKAQRGATPKKPVEAPADIEQVIRDAASLDELKAIWDRANGEGWITAQVTASITSRRKALEAIA